MDYSFIFFKNILLFLFFYGVILMAWVVSADQDRLFQEEDLCPSVIWEQPWARALGLHAEVAP